MDNILNTITAYREERKWSLYDLATHAELKTSTISTWYNNNATPTIPSLVKICDAFQITLSEFFAKAEGNESKGHGIRSICHLFNVRVGKSAADAVYSFFPAHSFRQGQLASVMLWAVYLFV